MSEAILVKGSYSESNTRTLVFKEVKIPVDSWTEIPNFNPSSKDNVYKYYATGVCTGLTDNFIPEVIFSTDDAVSGIFGPTCESGTNSITIYAKSIPETEITFMVKGTEVL